MIDRFRTRLARLIIRHLTRPRELVIRAWLWLAADTDDVEVKWLCLHADRVNLCLLRHPNPSCSAMAKGMRIEESWLPQVLTRRASHENAE